MSPKIGLLLNSRTEKQPVGWSNFLLVCCFSCRFVLQVCEYKIVCDQAAGDIRPYPQCSDSNWGPGTPVQQYGLTPSHSNAILAAPNGRAEVSH